MSGKILNIGSGKRPIEGAVNLDWNPESPGATHSWDIDYCGLAFDSNSFDEIIAYHILEHIHDLPKVIREIHRVGKNGARVKIEVPHFTNPQFYDDISHVRPFSENTIPHLCDDKNEGALCVTGKFKLIKNIVLGEAWSREKPTVVVAEIEIVK